MKGRTPRDVLLSESRLFLGIYAFAFYRRF